MPPAPPPFGTSCRQDSNRCRMRNGSDPDVTDGRPEHLQSIATVTAVLQLTTTICPNMCLAPACLYILSRARRGTRRSPSPAGVNDLEAGKAAIRAVFGCQKARKGPHGRPGHHPAVASTQVARRSEDKDRPTANPPEPAMPVTFCDHREVISAR